VYPDVNGCDVASARKQFTMSMKTLSQQPQAGKRLERILLQRAFG
jgi:hypothetical protein